MHQYTITHCSFIICPCYCYVFYKLTRLGFWFAWIWAYLFLVDKFSLNGLLALFSRFSCKLKLICSTGDCKLQCNMVWSLQTDCTIILRVIWAIHFSNVPCGRRRWTYCKLVTGFINSIESWCYCIQVLLVGQRLYLWPCAWQLNLWLMFAQTSHTIMSTGSLMCPVHWCWFSAYHKICLTGRWCLHSVLYGAGLQHFMGYQSHSYFLFPPRWAASRQACWSQQARVAEEGSCFCRFSSMREVTTIVVCLSLSVSFYICCGFLDILGVNFLLL